jgi:histidyl-tRNA synthetase
MSEKRQFRAIKGVRDILPPESHAWNCVEQAARDVFEAYGYGEIRLPIFEEAELFARSVGQGTDIVSKEMYTLPDPSFRRIEVFRASLEADLQKQSYSYLYQWFTTLVYELDEALKRGDLDQERIIPTVVEQLKEMEAEWRPLVDNHSPEAVAKKEDFVSRLQGFMQVLDFTAGMVLRPEATASVCRAYIEHGMHTRPGNVKLYYIGPMFRRERPQKGRYRQFYQIGAEVLTASPNKEETQPERLASAAVDAEVLEMLLHFFARIGLGQGSATGGGLTLYYNSIGCRECRPKYVAALKAALQAPEVRAKLGPDSQRRIETNPLRVLDSKVESEQAVIETLPRIGEHLCAACREHLAALREQFKLRGIEGAENWRLVRGLDYYTRTTFEITAPGLGSQNAVCGGGRYDGLVELLGGPPTKGIGFAIGTDRVMLALEHLGKLAATAGCDVFVAWMGAAAQAHAIRLARKLRDAGFAVEVPPEELKFRKSLDLANRLGARFALIIGENEIAAGRYALKRLADGTQRELTEGELVEFLSGDRAIGPSATSRQRPDTEDHRGTE